MTARSGKARGYLSQLAEPVPQGEPVLSARRDLSARMRPPIPVIEDVVYHQSQPARAAAHLPQSDSSALYSVPIIQTHGPRNEKDVETAEPGSAPRPASETTADQNSTRRSQESESALTGAYVRQSLTTINRAEPVEQSTKRFIDFSSNEGPQNSKLNNVRPATDRHETPYLRESGVNASAQYSSEANSTPGAFIPAKQASGAPSLVTASNDRQPQTIRSESRPSVASVCSVLPESPRNFGAQVSDAKGSNAPSNVFNNQNVSINTSPNANRKSVKSEPRVVIGTVEIRARISQPAPIATPPIRQFPDRNLDQAYLHGGAHPAPLDSLVRGLGWNFGLIQG